MNIVIVTFFLRFIRISLNCNLISKKSVLKTIYRIRKVARASDLPKYTFRLF